MRRGEGFPLPAEDGSHCLPGERGRRNEGKSVGDGSRRRALGLGVSGRSSTWRRSRGPGGGVEDPGFGGWPAGELGSPGPQPAKRGCSVARLPRAAGGRRRRNLGELGGTAHSPPRESRQGWGPIPFPGSVGALGLRSPQEWLRPPELCVQARPLFCCGVGDAADAG